MQNKDYPASLELRKVYQVFADEQASRFGQIRVIDESGEGYLYPEEYFVPIKLPQAAERIWEGNMRDNRCNNGLDNRYRDSDGEIRRKRGDTLVSTLRREYGDSFATGFRKDAKLKTVLEETNSDSLSDYLKHRR